jgi:hypothetical protein
MGAIRDELKRPKKLAKGGGLYEKNTKQIELKPKSKAKAKL